jgi:type IV pilus assembly protein PilE
MGRGAPASRGFSLIELMIAVAIVAILARVAMAAYFNAERKSNRGAAETFLATIAQQEQQYFIDNRGFATCPAPIAVATCALNLTIPASTTAFYTVSVTANNGNTPPTFSATAVPVAGSYQAQDSAGTLSIDNLGVKTPSGVW